MTRPRLVWVLLGRHVGDNAQVRALAEGLGWPTEVKTLRWRSPRPWWTPFYGARRSLAPLTPEARAAMVPPWPDLVLAVGWRSVPVARWIAAQGGGALVHIGGPRTRLTAFDLVFTTPQYGVPDAPNVVRLPGPLGAPSEAELAAAATMWRPRLAHLPRPWIAVMVGGTSPPLVLRAREGARLGAAAAELARAQGGSLLVATSPRTSAAATRAVVGAIDVPAHVFTWGAEGQENPYRGYLALADAFVVTGESVSMLHEAARTGRPLHIFPLPRVLPIPRTAPPIPGITTLYRRGLMRPPRRVDVFSQALIDAGRAVPLGTPWPPGRVPEAPPDPLPLAVDGVAALMQERCDRG